MIRRCEQLLGCLRKIPVKYCLGGILVISFLLKLLRWYWEPTVSRDGCFYLRLIQTWYDSGGIQEVLKAFSDMWVPPLPLYLIKRLMSLGLSAEAAGVGLNIILGTFTPLWIYGIAWEVTQKRKVAFCAALLAAVNPSLNMLSIQVQRDMIYLSLIGVALWLIIAGIRREKWWLWFCAGILCGCAMHTRFETLEFIAIIPAALFFLCCAKHLKWRRGLCYGFLFFFCFAGSIYLLSSLMHTNEYIYKNYDRYYRFKFDGLMEKFKKK